MDLQTIYTSSEAPKKVTERINRSTVYYVPYNIIESNGVYEYQYISLLPENYNYGGMVDAIIGVKYSLQETLAILNNYLFDPTNEKYKREFLELQNFRIYAKSEAKKYFNL